MAEEGTFYYVSCWTASIWRKRPEARLQTAEELQTPEEVQTAGGAAGRGGQPRLDAVRLERE